MYTDAGKEKRNKKNWKSSECRVPRIISATVDISALV